MSSDRHRELIERLVEDARPVAPLWSPAVRLALWLGLATVIFMLTVHAGLRRDLGARLGDPLFCLELVTLLTGAVALAALAFRAAVPGREPGRREVGVAAGLVALAAVLWLRLPMRTEMPISEFVHVGSGCMARTVLLAAAPWAALLVALRRGAPLAPVTAALLAAGAAFVMAFAVMRLVCNLDELLHILVWHAGPILGGMAVSALIGVAWLSRWRRGDL